MPVQSFDNANAFHRAMRRFIATKVGVALFRPTAHHIDRFVSNLTNGRRSAAYMLTGVPAVMLTTTGAKSGEPRTVAIYGIPHPDGLAVIASNFGGTKHPAWYHNLKAHPRVQVLAPRRSGSYEAHEAEGPERERLWAQAVDYYAGYGAYQDRAGARRIPVMVLSPVSA